MKDSKSLKKLISSSLGFSTLEQAILLPFVMIFIIGITDINSALQAYTAMQDGVSEALRCLTPSDGECTIDKSKISARYPVSRAHAVQQWLIPQYSYNADLYYLSSPTLANASYDLQTSTAPIVNVGNNTASALNPTFSYVEVNQIISEKQLGKFKGSLNDNNLSSFVVLGEVTLNPISKLSKDYPCYEANVLNENNEKNLTPNFSSKCSEFVNLVIQIYGTNVGSDKNAIGNIHLYYASGKNKPKLPSNITNLDEIPNWISLGGRQFSGSTFNNDASLYTRGSKIENLRGDPNLIVSIEEYSKDYNDIKVKRGDTTWLLFILEKQSKGTVAWQAKEIKVYGDKIIHQEFCNLPCNNEEENKDNCNAILPNSNVRIPNEAIKSIGVPSPLTACLLQGKRCNYVNRNSSLMVPDGFYVISNKIFTKDKNISDLSKSNDFSCLKSVHKNLDNEIQNPETSLLYGTHDPSCNWEENIRRELSTITKYAQYATISRNEVGKKVSKDRPSENLCYITEATLSAISPFEEVIGSPFLQSEIPDYCFNSSEWICSIGAPIINDYQNKIFHDTNIAIQKAKRAIGVSLPWVKWNCNKSSCSNVTITLKDDSFDVEAKVKLSLNFLKLLGLKEYSPTISYNESANWEGKFAR